MSASVFESHDGLGLAQLVRDGEVSPTGLMVEAIERLEAADSAVGLLADRYYEFARDQITDGLPNGPFTGIPFLRKDDGADIAGLSTTLGMRLLTEAKAPHSSTLASRYMNAGLVFVGSGKVPPGFVTFDTAKSWYGPCLNPWNSQLSSGGSSSGSGAAVATGAIPMAHGNDGGGSLRIPAAWMGAFTMKPSRGRLPTGPVLTEQWTGFAAEGHITRSVRDNAALTDATMGMELGARYDAPQPARTYLHETQHECDPLRIAMMTKDNLGHEFHPHHQAAIEQTAQLLVDLGHRVDEAQPAIDFESLSQHLYVCVAGDVRDFFDAFGEGRGHRVADDELETLIATFRAWGGRITARDYSRVNELSMQFAYDVAVFMEAFDVIVSPTLPCPPPPVGAIYEHEADMEAFRHHQDLLLNLTMVHNVTGQPAASVPLFHSPDNLPIGIMLTGRYGDESTLYGLSAQLERARPWWDRIPDMSSL